MSAIRAVSVLSSLLLATACVAPEPSTGAAPAQTEAASRDCADLSVELEQLDLASLPSEVTLTAARRVSIEDTPSGRLSTWELLLDEPAFLDVRFDGDAPLSPTDAEVRRAAAGQGAVVAPAPDVTDVDAWIDALDDHPPATYVVYAGMQRMVEPRFTARCADGRVLTGELDAYAAPVSGAVRCDLPPEDVGEDGRKVQARFCD